MTRSDVLAVTPLLILGATPLVVILAAAARRRHGAALAIALAGLALALAALPAAAGAAPAAAGALITVDGVALSFTALLIFGAAVAALLARPYLARATARPEEYYALLGIAVAAAAALASTQHLGGLFLAVEALSVALYGLIAYTRERPASLEAGLKYLLMTGAASAVLLFGAALVYADTGGLDYAAIAERAAGAESFGAPGAAGMALILVGLGFKLSLFPFHMWVADVYQGAPAPTAAALATISKAAVAAAALRLFADTGALAHPGLGTVVAAVAVATMIAGNLLALMQMRVKRLLAYSSMAHFGFALVAVIAAGPLGLEALLYYLAAYFLMALLAFGVVSALSSRAGDADDARAFQGLCWRSPLLGLCLALALLALIGIPPTAGFLAKLYILAAGADAARYGLVVAVAATTAIGAFYYLRLLVIALARPEAGAPDARPPTGTAVLLGVLAALLVALGAVPGLLDPLLAPASDALAR